MNYFNSSTKEHKFIEISPSIVSVPVCHLRDFWYIFVGNFFMYSPINLIGTCIHSYASVFILFRITWTTFFVPCENCPVFFMYLSLHILFPQWLHEVLQILPFLKFSMETLDEIIFVTNLKVSSDNSQRTPSRIPLKILSETPFPFWNKYRRTNLEFYRKYFQALLKAQVFPKKFL